MLKLTNKQANFIENIIMTEGTEKIKNNWITIKMLANIDKKNYDNTKQEGGEDDGIQR